MKKAVKTAAGLALCLNSILGPLAASVPVHAAAIMNLARVAGAEAVADCEDGNLTADKVIDGETVERTSRWSSKNIWADDDPAEANHETSHGHWIRVGLGRVAKVHSVKLYWEQTNAKEYVLEASDDAENWHEVYHATTNPSSNVETIEFSAPEEMAYLRLRTIEMDTNADHGALFPYYQNVSLYEIEIFGEPPTSAEINLSLMKGTVATSDCFTGTYAPDLAIDNDLSFKSKWSSENIWDSDNPADSGHTASHAHWLQLEFPEVVSANRAVIQWEKPNAEIYDLEYSMDGENWNTIRHFTEKPGPLPTDIDIKSATEIYVDQTIEFDAPIQMKYIRLRTEKISTDGEFNIYFPYHQNLVVREFQVFGDDPDFAIQSAISKIEAPEIITSEDGSRKLGTVTTDEGFTVKFAGADFEQVIGDDGTVYDTIEDKMVNIGYTVSKDNRTLETGDLPILVPANITSETPAVNEKPSVVPELSEWKGSEGTFALTSSSRILYDDAELKSVAESFASDLEEVTGIAAVVLQGTAEEAKTGDIVLDLNADHVGLGEEGYYAHIEDSVRLCAEDATGLYWSLMSVLQILEQNDNTMPKGDIRDYPRYEVRGFGIDVGRQTVSLDMLKDIAKNMSYYKMNDLHVHLNDNEILGYSGKIDSVENALTAYSGFRLESTIQNKDGVHLTNEDMYYTKDGFRSFIQEAREIGINVVPEIDSPAHSLAFTKLFPEYAFTSDPSHVDQIDLSVPGAVDLMKSVYAEYLDGENPVFDEETTVHIGMDEYFGNGNTYREYGNTLIDLMGNRTVRMWGSLSNIKGSVPVQNENVQMNIWHTMWANPGDMYDLGYSLINSQNRCLYVIPGGGWDYLDNQQIYDEWIPNIFVDSQNNAKTYNISTWSDQMLGGSYTMWHDLTGNIDYGLTEYDDYVRFAHTLPVVSEKLWAMGDDKTLEEITEISSSLGTAPGSNPYNSVEGLEGVIAHYDFDDEAITDASGNENHALSHTAEAAEGKRGSGLDLSGNKTVNLPLDLVGPDYRASMWVYRNPGDTSEQVLFSREVPNGKEDSAEKYHTYEFKAVQKDTGKVGISREYYDLSFDYTLPEGEWVYLTFEGTQDFTSLYVNNELVNTLGSKETFTEHATSPFAAAVIGHAEKGFNGKIDRLTITDGTDVSLKDASALQTALEGTADLKEESFTPASWTAYQTALSQAQKVMETVDAPDALQFEADRATLALSQAKADLVKKGNKMLLEQAVARAEAIAAEEDLSDLNPVVKDYFESALQEAKAVLADVNASQNDVNAAWTKLVQAIQMLDFRSDKTALAALIAEAEVIEANLDQYEEEGKAEFQAALDYARSVMDDDAALNEQSIQAAMDRLTAAMNAMNKRVDLDFTLLDLLIETAESADLNQYTSTGKDEFAAALEEAKTVRMSAKEQSEIDASVRRLNTAWMNLRRVPNEEDVKALQEFSVMLASLDFEAFVPAARVQLKTAQNIIDNILNMDEPDDQSVQAALVVMNQANEILENPANRISVTEKPDTDLKKPDVDAVEQEVKVTADASVQKTEVSTAKSVKTAAETAWLVSGSAAIAGLAGLFGLKRRNR